MSKKTTLKNAIDQVHEFSANHYDEIVPIHEMAFDSLGSMWIGAKPVSVLPSAQRLLSNRLRVPYAYLSRCPRGLGGGQPELLAQRGAETARNIFLPFCRGHYQGRVYRTLYSSGSHGGAYQNDGKRFRSRKRSPFFAG